jgi:prepilin-type N-terminal cleavage/methylation domain-containing protein
MQQRGFTLIEVVIAAAIVSLLATTIMTTMSIAFRARATAARGVETQRSVRLALDAIGRDLLTALPPSQADSTTALRSSFLAICNGPVPAGVTSSSISSSSLGSTVASDNPSQNSLGAGITFSNTAPPIRTIDGGGDVQRVSFALLSDNDINRPAPARLALPGGTNSNASPVPDASGPFLIASSLTSQTSSQGLLVRRVRRQLLAPITQVPEDQILCRGVTSFAARYYDGSQWTATWDSSAIGNTLPLAVEVTLEVALPVNGGTSERVPGSYTLTRVFSLPCGRSVSTAGASTTP